MRFVDPVVLFRGLTGFLVLLYFVLAGAILGLRYWVLPHITDYRGQIESVVSSWVGAPVHIGGIQAAWYRLNPELTLIDTEIRTEQGATVLHLPTVKLRLSWRSALTWRPELLQLRIENPHLAVRRDVDGLVYVAGFPLLALASSEAALLQTEQPAWTEADHPVARWLLTQPDVRIISARIDWQDDVGKLPSLRIPDVNVQLQASLFGKSRFSLIVPGELLGGRQWRLQAEWERSLLAPLDPLESGEWGSWHGLVYLSADTIDLASVQPWLTEVEQASLEGLASGRAWFEFHQGRWQAWQMDVAVRNARGLIPSLSTESWAVSEARLQVDRVGAQTQVGARIEQALLHLPEVFETPVNRIQSLQGTLLHTAHNGQERWQWSNVQLQAGESGHLVHLSSQGNWVPEEGLSLGRIDLGARLEKAEAGAIAHWMPLEVDQKVRDWLRLGLRAGQIHSADVVLKGDLEAFPFGGAARDAGVFRIEGRVSDVAIDLVPDSQPRWPLLSGLAAQITIDGPHLGADISGGDIRVGQRAVIELGESRLDIRDMDAHTRLEVAAKTSGEGEAYLAYLRHSPLAKQAEQHLGAMQLGGRITLPLQVKVDLSADEPTAVAGTVELSGNRLTKPEWPAPLTALRGQVHFTDSVMEFRGVQGQWLGGDIRINARTRENGSGSAEYQGRVTVGALRARWPSPYWQTVNGQMAYQGAWRREVNGNESVTFHSELVGLGLELPPPLNKAPQASWPLRTRWEQTASGITGQLVLNNRWELKAAWPIGADTSAMPPRLALGAPGSVILPAQGWTANLDLATLNLDAWQLVWPRLTSVTGSAQSVATDGALLWDGLPLPLRIDAKVQQLMLWEQEWSPLHLRFEITRNDVVRVRVDADEAKGWVGWRPESVAGPERLDVNFEYLQLPRQEAQAPTAVATKAGKTQDSSASVAPWQDPSRWPYVELQVDNLHWGHMALGALSLSAKPGHGGAGWLIDKMVLANPDIALKGQGAWLLAKEKPQTSFDVSGVIHDVGRLFDRLGMPDVVKGGHGSVDVKAAWKGAPWDLTVPKLQANVDLLLNNGRFMQISSAAGRLLATLSLQALASAIADPDDNSFQSGLAWDSLRANAEVMGGQMQLRGFEMQGPSAAALLSGDVDLLNETQNLKVLVMPRVDASAAALLAGIAINPVVGLSAFLGQWLLREPLAQVFKMEYAVTGSWDEPQVQRIQGADKTSAVP